MNQPCSTRWLIAALLIAFQSGGCDSGRDAEFIVPEIVEAPVDATWADVFFESIRAKNRNVGIEDLESRQIAEGEIEVRIYSGFGSQVFKIGGHPLDLLILSFTPEGVRSARYPRSPDGPMIVEHPDPAFWNTLYRNGLFDLPDSSAVDGYFTGMRDGVGYVVELKSADAYRHYRYGNPQHSDTPEAAAMVAIIEVLKESTTGEPRFGN